jgi:hypothetical protein
MASAQGNPCYPAANQLVKCFPTNGIYLDIQRGLRLGDATTNYVELKAPAAVTTYSLVFPAAQGGSNTLFKNNAGTLSWSKADLTTDVTGILPTANGGTGQNSTATFPTSGVVVTAAGTQSLTNKTLDTTNTVGLFDTLFELHDDASPTKVMQFQLSPITAGQTRILTVPDTNLNLVGTSELATFTNKTISGASNTITNVSLTTGVTGVLPLANGGTNKNATAVNGGLVYSDADSFEITSAGASQNWVLSGGAGAPTMSNTTTTGKTIDGSADEIQLTVQGHSTQTSDLFVSENSSGTDLFKVSGGGAVTIGPTSTTNTHTANVGASSRAIVFGPGTSNTRPGIVADNAGNSTATSISASNANPVISYGGGTLLIINDTYANVSSATNFGQSGGQVGMITTGGAWTVGPTTAIGSTTFSGNKIVGVTDNSAATTAGYVGEELIAQVNAGSGTAYATATAKTVASITPTTGDWEIDGDCFYIGSGVAVTTNFISAVSATTDSLPGGGTGGSPSTAGEKRVTHTGIDIGTGAFDAAITPFRYSCGGATACTTRYLVCYSDYTGGGTLVSFSGNIRARRAR